MIKIETPHGDPLRRWSASGARIEKGSDGALFEYLAGSKHSVVAEPVADAGLVDALLADPNGKLTPLRGNELWQIALLELWLQRHGVTGSAA